jgi:subtilisin-like proprotein convertase family protein
MLRIKKVKILIPLLLASSVASIFFMNCSGSGFEAVDVFSGDPLIGMAWHLHNTGQAVYAAKPGTAGVDMNLMQTFSQGVTGFGVKVMISDSGLEDQHEDLHDNFVYGAGSKDYTKAFPYTSLASAPQDPTDNHGTSVAGILAAIGGNGKGSRGVASKGSIISSNLLSAAVTTQTNAMAIDQLSGDFDISNMSWGISQNLVDDDPNGDHFLYEAKMKEMILSMRHGKGPIYVKSGGNDFLVSCYGGDPNIPCIGSSNFDRDNTNPYTIMVAALDANGASASYSSPGSNLWISSFGGEFGTDSPALVTTDRMGCLLGESLSNSSSKLGFEKGKFENSHCNYTVTFNGTSSAAPTISGAVALLLEVNPTLTWRDVKVILAKSARGGTITTSIAHPQAKKMPTGYTWEQGWIANGAGFKFHNWYGFGSIDVDAAVALARSYKPNLGTYHETIWFSSGAGDLNLPIPDNSATGANHSLLISSEIVTVEAVRIKVKITHPAISEIALELTSPSGTKSILVNAVNSLTNQADFTGGEVFLSNAFYGETSAGTWSLRVVDAQAGQTGILNSWSINFVGGM